MSSRKYRYYSYILIQINKNLKVNTNMSTYVLLIVFTKFCIMLVYIWYVHIRTRILGDHLVQNPHFHTENWRPASFGCLSHDHHLRNIGTTKLSTASNTVPLHVSFTICYNTNSIFECKVPMKMRVKVPSLFTSGPH